jgi:hypothetical protein
MLLLPSLSLWKVKRLSRSWTERRSSNPISNMLLSLSSKKIGPVALGSNQMNETVTSLEKAIDNPFFHLVVASSQACLIRTSSFLFLALLCSALLCSLSLSL